MNENDKNYGFLNVHGIRNNKFIMINKLMEDIDILCLAETWLKDHDVNVKLDMQVRIICSIDANTNITGGRMTGGMVLLAKHDINVNIIMKENNLILIKHNLIYILFIYNPHNNNSKHIIDSIRKQNCINEYNEILLIGDLNLQNNTKAKNELDEFLIERNIFEVYIKTYTYRLGNIRSSPDKIYTNSYGNHTVRRYNKELSDHKPIIYKIINNKKNIIKCKYSIGKLKDQRIIGIVKNKMEIYTKRNFGNTNLDDLVINELYNKFENTVEESIRIIKRKNQMSRMKLPTHIREKIALKNKIRKDKNRNIDELNILRMIIKREIREMKNNPKPSSKNPFIIANCNENLKIMRSSIDSPLRKSLSQIEMNNLLRDSYPDAEEKVLPLDELIINKTKNINFGIEMYEIKGEIKFMRNGKSSGPSFIRSELLKIMPDNLLGIIKYMFNKILESKRLPEEWKRISLACVPKGNNEVRPIGITNQLRKVFEKILLNKIKIEFIPNQGGFISNLGTQHHSLILDNALRRYNGNAIAVALDIKKAYDTVNRNMLYTKLNNKFQIPYNIIEMLYELLENNIIELTQGSLAISKILSLGLPQGCVLSPLLFNVFINDIIESLSNTHAGNVLLYADDILIISDNENKVNEIIACIEEHSVNNKYKLNPMKCSFMTKKNIDIKIYNECIEKVSVLKYLGYFFNLKGLDLNENLLTIRSKIFKRAALIKRFITSSNIINPMHTNTAGIIINHYKTYCRPILDYYITLMTPYKTLLYKTEIIQKGILKFLFGLVHRLPSKLLYSLIEIEIIEFRAKRLTNIFRKRIEMLNDKYICKGVYNKNNTKIIKFIKNTVNEYNLNNTSKKDCLQLHLNQNKVIPGFCITHINNKKNLFRFTKVVNLKVKENITNEDKEQIYNFIRNILHKYV